MATGTDAHYAREWLNAQAAGSIVDYDPATARYTLPAEHAVALTDESSPAFLPGLFQIAVGTVADAGRIPDAARRGTGIGWHERRCPPRHGAAGTSTTATCTTAASGSSAPATTPTSSRSGCRRWASPTGFARARRSPTSGAATVPPRC